jgi:uncharacterized protein
VSNSLPSREQAIQLLHKIGCSENVIRHCEAVSELAKETAEICQKKGLKVNLELVEIGALLHDIGRSKTHSVHHAVDGSKIAKKAGLPNSVVAIIERHVGGGITAVEAEELGWPRGIYVPLTLEEKIVSYADKLIGTSNRVPLKKTLDKLREEKLDAAAENVQKLYDEISKLIREDL